MSFVFHGGSGSSLDDIRYAIEAGVVKMNIDTDTQWAFWDGMNSYQKKNKDYLQAQILPICLKCILSFEFCSWFVRLSLHHISEDVHPISRRFVCDPSFLHVEPCDTPFLPRIGNPEGAEKPNKKYYDPRMSLRSGEEFMADRLVKCMEDLKCIDRL